MAADRTGRVCCGIEIDPLYVDVAIRRWQRLTRDRSIHAESCVDFAALELEETGARHDR
jgi:DNA modification methylase